MNILILNWRDPKNPKSGGAEIVTFQHAKRWVKKGNTVWLFTSSFKGALEKENQEGVTIIRQGNQYSVFLFAFIFYLFYKGNFDIVVDEIHGIPFFTPFYVKKPIVVFIHEVAKEIWDYMYFYPINILGRFMEKVYLNLYKTLPFWTDASSTIDELIKYGIEEENCIAIPCPITNPVTNIPMQKEENLTCIFVSRVVRMKGIEEVIKAFAFMYKENSLAKLWIIGKGEEAYLKRLQEMAKEYDVAKSIQFFGKLDEKKKLNLMSRAHLLLHASVKEGWGLVVIEAASQGTPSVVYNVSGLRDSVKNGVTGVVLERNSPYDMAKEAIKLLSDKKRYSLLQKNGLKWAKELDWDVVASQSLLFLEKYANLH